MARYYLQLPDAFQIAEIVAGKHNAHHLLPPPGMHLGIDPSLEWLNVPDGVTAYHLPIYVEGSPPDGAEDDWYWATVGDILTPYLVPDVDQLDWLLEKLAAIASKTIGEVLSLPLLKKGSANAIMRWLRSSFRGTLGNGVEQWQFKLDWGNPGDDPDYDQAARLAFANQLAGLIGGWWLDPSTGSIFPSSSKVVEVGVAQCVQTDATDENGEGGNLVSTPNEWALLSGTGQPGQGTFASLPFEVACAVTLQTDHRGQSGRGRCYLPPFGTNAMTLTPPGTFNETFVTYGAQGIVDIMDAVKADSDLVPVVVSRRRIILNEVTSVNVGKVPDSQRRRRKSQDEARVEIWP